MKTYKITLRGIIIGNTWESSCEFSTQEFDKEFTPGKSPFTYKWCGLRDALMSICKCGDFESASILKCFITVTRFNKNGTLLRTTKELSPTKLTKDLFASNELKEKLSQWIADCEEID